MERIVGYAIVGFVLYTIITHAMPKTASLAGLDAVPEKPSHFEIIGTPDDATGVLELSDKKSGDVLARIYTDDRGGLFQDPKQTASSSLKAEYTPVTTALRLGVDLGAFGGVSKQGFVGGVRVSPARIFENISPDVIAGPECLGLGVSFYLPRSYGPQWLSHAGVGAWYASDLHGSSGPVFGLTLSTR